MNTVDVNNILSERLKSNYNTLKDVPHPFLMKDMEKSVNRLSKAIDNNEKILLVGDYDVDGISSTSIIVLFFEKYCPSAQFNWVIPDREKHGYGVNEKILKENKGYDLVFTVDNGISAVEAGKYCLEHNIDLIITDHHTIPEIVPQAYSIVNPQQSDCSFPFKEICGAEIAWYLIKSIALIRNIKMDSSLEFLEIVGLAIVSDVMPLIGLNRILLKVALNKMNDSSLPFFIIMKKFIYGETYKSEDLAFKVAPMLNASGRLKHAKISVYAICSKSVEEAYFRISELEEINNNRKEMQKDILNKAFIEADKQKNDNAIVICGDWETGIIGIVASNLVEKYNKPALVFSTKTTPGMIKMSGRSLGNIDLIGSLRDNEKYFQKLGGHFMAVGASMEVKFFETFKSAFSDYLQKKYLDNDYFISDSVSLGNLSLSSLNESLFRVIDKYEPYGEKNPAPIFSGTYTISDFKILKSIHIKFTLFDKETGVAVDAIIFNAEDYINIIKIGDDINISFSVSKNYFNGNVTYQLMIKKIML